MIWVNFFLLLHLTIGFLKSSYQVELCGKEERDQLESSSGVHNFRLRGPRFALGEPLPERGLGWAGLHAGSSPVLPCRVSLAHSLVSPGAWDGALWYLEPDEYQEVFL